MVYRTVEDVIKWLWDSFADTPDERQLIAETIRIESIDAEVFGNLRESEIQEVFAKLKFGTKKKLILRVTEFKKLLSSQQVEPMPPPPSNPPRLATILPTPDALTRSARLVASAASSLHQPQNTTSPTLSQAETSKLLTDLVRLYAQKAGVQSPTVNLPDLHLRLGEYFPQFIEHLKQLPQLHTPQILSVFGPYMQPNVNVASLQARQALHSMQNIQKMQSTMQSLSTAASISSTAAAQSQSMQNSMSSRSGSSFSAANIRPSPTITKPHFQHQQQHPTPSKYSQQSQRVPIPTPTHTPTYTPTTHTSSSSMSSIADAHIPSVEVPPIPFTPLPPDEPQPHSTAPPLTSQSTSAQYSQSQGSHSYMSNSSSLSSSSAAPYGVPTNAQMMAPPPMRAAYMQSHSAASTVPGSNLPASATAAAIQALIPASTSASSTDSSAASRTLSGNHAALKSSPPALPPVTIDVSTPTLTSTIPARDLRTLFPTLAQTQPAASFTGSDLLRLFLYAKANPAMLKPVEQIIRQGVDQAWSEFNRPVL